MCLSHSESRHRRGCFLSSERITRDAGIPFCHPTAHRGGNLSEDDIHDYITQNIPGDCLLAVGDEDLIKLHFHTNEPWKVLEYAASLGDLFDIVVENMERQENGLQG